MPSNRKSIFVAMFCCCLISSSIFAQTDSTQVMSENLVNNYSFENYLKCPQNFIPEDRSHKIIPGWTYPTIATPDYFNRCAPANKVGVPLNFAGESEPKTGNGYVGAILSGSDDGYREYIQGSLSKAMEPGKQYCITYSYKLASYSKFIVDQISFYLGEAQIRNDSKVNLPFKPQINNTSGLFLDNIDEWEEMCTIYEAAGKEEFFIIGNFKSYENTNYVATDKNMKNLRNKEYAYYYFDDVIIRPLDNCTDCPCVHHDFEAQVIDSTYSGGFNPITGEVDPSITDGRIKVAMVGGTPPYRVEWSNGMTGAEIEGLPDGEYVYTALDAYNCQETGVVNFVAPEILIDEFDEGLQSIEEGSSIVLDNIFFEFNKTALLPESYSELDKISSFVIDNNIQLIEIGGHTDSEGSEAYNSKLSDGRAKSVVNYLKTKGIAPERMKSVGYGESKPIDTNQTEEGRAVNRRVEFTLLKK